MNVRSWDRASRVGDRDDDDDEDEPEATKKKKKKQKQKRRSSSVVEGVSRTPWVDPA